MSSLPYNPVTLAEMTRAVQAERPDADWHELEPVLRSQWRQSSRSAAWEQVREVAAAQFRVLRGLPDVAPVMAVGPASAESAR